MTPSKKEDDFNFKEFRDFCEGEITPLLKGIPSVERSKARQKVRDTKDFNSLEVCYLVLEKNYNLIPFEDIIKRYKGITPEQEGILISPNIIDIVQNEFEKFIVGEEDTRLTIFLTMFGGSLVENAEPTSKNLMVNDESGAGKDFITKKVLDILPEEIVIRRKRVSEKVFTYWHNTRFEPTWTWNGIIFYNEDISNYLLNSDVFKVMSSSEGINKSTILINQTPHEIETKGKPCMIVTIANAYPNLELLRRYPICNLNTSEDQTKAILKRKAEFHESGIKPSYDSNVKEALRKLVRVKVKVPFASKLVNVLSSKNIIIRTHFDRFVDYIKFSCAIHQFQRKEDKDSCLIATKQDYEIGRMVLIKTTSNVFSIPLTKVQRKILDILIELDRKFYSVSDLEPKVSFVSDRTLRKELDKLAESGFLEKDSERREGIPKPLIVYKYLDLYKIKIPTWEELQNISNTSLTSNTSFSSNTSNTQISKGEDSEQVLEVNEAKQGSDGVFELFEVNELNSQDLVNEKKQINANTSLTSSASIPSNSSIRITLEENDVYLNGKFKGNIFGNRYVTIRRPEHYMKKFQGFGVSKSILELLESRNIKFVEIQYQGKEGNKTLRALVSHFLASFKYHIDNSEGFKDLQLFLSESEMELIS